MRRALRWLGVALAVVLGVPLLILGGLAVAIALVPWPEPAAEQHSLPGVFHVHAELSHDGFGTVEEAAAAAKKVGARFLVLTEHNKLRPDGPQLIDGVLIVPGVELSSKFGHVVATGPNLKVLPDRGVNVLASIHDRGGAAILAHPVNRKRPWSDPGTEGFGGFEALSLDSSLREAQAHSPWRLVLALAAVLGDARKAGSILAVVRPDEALRRYDELTATRDVKLLCGVDAHGLPPYVSSFGALQLHLPGALLGGDLKQDAANVALGTVMAPTFCSVPALGDAGAFRFQASDLEVVAEGAPADATVILFRDGREAARGKGSVRIRGEQPGVWRAEVHRDAGFPWGDDALWIATSAQRVVPWPADRPPRSGAP